ncbi:uncharacterized protein LOC129586005 isoform X2 [Paramacrobiotus metropolitanus]|nr:uncharacterized protein LOC129586005 isoform X2 [Paramacrobiotus metropolitanus]XP_055334957.1 uncharacterized protein LOC129586005 isoform X2 [Paramacrobiotus metropolitanus]XP_055334958.1 uncharacterized protein LOC129586005 isoform X2 [Paramacrobiotus metropolitanus]XP_055334959.1 uncharacterized protein LOC129586005 isoform X2 [Paramacrobiotus metropolitanus]
MGPYLVSLQINNLKIAELQDALTYAWLPSLEKSNWTATRTEIIQTFNGTGYFSQNGMPLMVIVYTLPVPDIFSNFSRNLPRYPWLYARNSTLHELTRIDPPVIGDFIQRLQQKGLPVYEGPVFSKTNVLENLYLRANFTSGYFDTDQLKADVMGFTQQLRVKEGCGDANMSDVDVHFGLLKPHVMAVRRNRAFSDLKLMPMPFVITVQQKKYVQYAADLAVGLANHSDRYYKQDMSNATETKIPGFGLVELPPVDPAFSFRMYLNRPLNVQYLPLLEVLMMSHLNTDRDPDGRVEVRLWDFDPNGWIVKFFVVLRHTKVPVPYASFVVDARLLYAANIYRKLDGFELRLSNASTAYKLMKDSYPAYWLDTIKASTLAQCEGESIWSLPVEEQLCPLKKTFTLYVERYSNLGLEDLISNTKWLPNSDKVLDAVQQAFAVANPVTVDRLTLTIALMERNDTLMTTAGRDAFKFTFALSYPKMEEEIYWKLWRYPSLDEMNGFLFSVANTVIAHTWTVLMPAYNYID